MATNKIQILYEDDDVLVINKPAGLVVHSDGRTKEPTVVNWILANFPKIRGVGDSIELRSKNYELSKKGKTHNSGFKIHNSEAASAALRPGIVHRLDRETSGALLIAKNQIAFGRLKKQFQRQEVHKTYHAFVYGSVKNDDGLIDRPIARSRTNPVLWSATRGRRGEEREAVTEYRVLGRYQGLFLVTKDSPWYSLLELSPHTGRTHQLRVHLKAINYPIVCDRLYAPNRDCALGFTRLALHSRAISFLHPATGSRMTVEAPYPNDFEHARTFL